MSHREHQGAWRQCLILVAVGFAAACSSTPTSPSRQSADVNPAALSSTTQVQAAAKPKTGTAGTTFVDTGGGVFGFAAAVVNGESGRSVQLTGDIVGTNFEPGTCHPGVDNSLGFPTFCVVFGDGPGQFTRARQGGTAFTTCECSVAGVGNPGDRFTLKISYPPAAPPQYPFGFTKFTFQGGTGALAGLRGQGTLDFAATPAVTFSYHFVAQ